MQRPLRLVTYNTHKSRGMDGRVRPDRIVTVLQEIAADIVALQEVLSIEGGSPQQNQSRYFADALGLELLLGTNRRYKGGAYGNVVLSRFPILGGKNYDLSVRGAREERGCLRAEIDLGHASVLHVYNVHLGTGYRERRRQARTLLDAVVAGDQSLPGPRVVLGDFNEWTVGLTSRFLAATLNSVDIKTHLRREKTYPGLFPVLHLDHVYFDDGLELERLALQRTRLTLLASDHLPLVADFRLSAPKGAERAPQRRA